MEKRKVKRAVVFYPCTMGVFILLIIILSFTTGAIRRELVLTLTGAVILAIWAYCLVMTLLLALMHRGRAKNISIRLEPEKIVRGGWTNAVYTENNSSYAGKKILQFPGILVRCRIILKTNDGRRVTYDFKPENYNGFRQNFQVNKRGAYFSAYDEFAVFDILGFFRFAYRIPAVETAASVAASSGAANGAARLLVSPDADAEPLPVRAMGGEANRQETSPTLERTDYLIDHRPYVPGDDPRRINWKLYGHGGELIVRQGEREPPPSSSLTILIDTQYDSLYSSSNEAVNSGAEAVDLLCENALAIINNAGKEINVQIGYTGGGASNRGAVSGNSLTQAELGFFLAYPAALPAQAETALPAVTADRGIVILALPRINTGEFAASRAALEKFLADNANRSIELIFIYAEGEKADAAQQAAAQQAAAQQAAAQQAAAQQAAAETCAGFYNRHYGVKAQVVGVR
jgi:hypothetical protein